MGPMVSPARVNDLRTADVKGENYPRTIRFVRRKKNLQGKTSVLTKVALKRIDKGAFIYTAV